MLATCSVAVHPVHADAGPPHSQEVDRPQMLSDSSLDFSSLVVNLVNCSDGIAIRCNHDKCHVHLQRASDHALEEVPVPRCNDNGAVPLVRESLFRCANDGHPMLPLLPLAIHAECGCGGRFAQAPYLLLQLVKLSLGDDTDSK